MAGSSDEPRPHDAPAARAFAERQRDQLALWGPLAPPLPVALSRHRHSLKGGHRVAGHLQPQGDGDSKDGSHNPALSGVTGMKDLVPGPTPGSGNARVAS